MKGNNYTTSFFARNLFVVIMLLLPNIAYSLERRLKMYEVNDTTTFENIKIYVLSSGLKYNMYLSSREGNLDTFAVYETEDHRHKAKIVYSPITRKPSSYRYTWPLDYSIEDDYTPQLTKTKLKGDKLYRKKCELYWTNIFNDLQAKYGKPTTVMVNERHGNSTSYRYIRTQQQLDTIQFPHLMGNLSHFEVYWENEKRKVSLAYQYGGLNNTSLEYEFMNKESHKLLIHETKEIENKKAHKRIIIGTLTILVSLLVVGLIAYLINKIRVRKEEERKQRVLKQEEYYALRRKEEDEKCKQELIRKEQLALEYNTHLTQISNEYGHCDKIIRIVPESVNPYQEIRVYNETKHIVLGKKAYRFSDILDCIVNDDIKEKDTIETYRHPSVATTKTDGSNLLSRAVVGGLLLGEAGAIIGGSTAKKNTIIENGRETTIHNREIEHNYTIVVTVSDIKNPNIRIKLGNDTVLKDDILSLFKVILLSK